MKYQETVDIMSLPECDIQQLRALYLISKHLVFLISLKVQIR